jgi:hypothetical protein
MTLTKGQKVSFTFYGKPETATIERIAGGIVWLDTARGFFQGGRNQVLEFSYADSLGEIFEKGIFDRGCLPAGCLHNAKM